jgi:hypothetical protein
VGIRTIEHRLATSKLPDKYQHDVVFYAAGNDTREGAGHTYGFIPISTRRTRCRNSTFLHHYASSGIDDVNGRIRHMAIVALVTFTLNRTERNP